MRAILEPLAADHGLRTVSARAHDIAAGDAELDSVVPADAPSELASELSGERLGFARVAGHDRDLFERTNAGDGAQMCARLHAGPDDHKGLRVLPREKVGRERRARGGACRGDRLAVEERSRRSGRGVERDDDRLMGRAVGVAREERDELRRERGRGRKIRGHRGEETLALGDERGDARRHGDLASRKVRERLRELCAEQIGVEERLHLGPCQYEHAAMVSERLLGG